MPHPHFVQHSMAIIIRVRPTEEFKYVAGDHRSKKYIPPSYAEAGEVLIPDANPKEVDPEETGKVEKAPTGFIKLLPKLTEKKVISSTFNELKNSSVGYLTSNDIHEHFLGQEGFITDDVSVEYLLVKRAKENFVFEENNAKDDRDNVFAGQASLPGGTGHYGENALDAVVRNTYEQTGYDLTDHEKFCFVAQSKENFAMRYLPNKRVIIAKPFIFCQLYPGVLQPSQNFVLNEQKIAMKLWSNVDFLYKCDLKKHLEYFATESFKRDLVHVKVAHLKVPNSENYTLNEAITDARKCDSSFAICGATLKMLLTLLESAPKTYDSNVYSSLSRKVFSIQLKYFNPQYLGPIGDIVSKYTVNQYLMNLDKKLLATYEERGAELRTIYLYPTIGAASLLIYLLKRRNQKVPEIAKM